MDMEIDNEKHVDPSESMDTDPSGFGDSSEDTKSKKEHRKAALQMSNERRAQNCPESKCRCVCKKNGGDTEFENIKRQNREEMLKLKRQHVDEMETQKRLNQREILHWEKKFADMERACNCAEKKLRANQSEIETLKGHNSLLVKTIRNHEVEIQRLKSALNETASELQDISEAVKPPTWASFFTFGGSIHKDLLKLVKRLSAYTSTVDQKSSSNQIAYERVAHQIQRQSNSTFSKKKPTVAVVLVIPPKHVRELDSLPQQLSGALSRLIDTDSVYITFEIVDADRLGSLSESKYVCALVLAWAGETRINFIARNCMKDLKSLFNDKRYLVMFRQTDVIVANDVTKKDSPKDVEKEKLPEAITQVADVYYSREKKLLLDNQSNLAPQTLQSLEPLMQWMRDIVEVHGK